MQVSIIMSEGTCKTKMKASDFRFTRVKGWLGSDQTERIEGWKTYIYEAAGKMKAVNTVKVSSGRQLYCSCRCCIPVACHTWLSCGYWHYILKVSC